MKYKALVSFSGALTAVKGQILEIEDEFLKSDLLNAGYIKKVTERKAVNDDNKGAGRGRRKKLAQG